MKLNKIQKDELKIFDIDDFTLEVASDIKRSGTFGEITGAVINDENIRVVLKKYKIPVTDTILNDDIIKEIIILQHLNQYPETATVKLYGICIEDNHAENKRYCYLVLESLDTDIHRISVKYCNDSTKQYGKFSPLQYKIIFYKCLKALNAIHSLGFIHNDIKLPNIMLHGNDIKFIDFGISKYLGLYPLSLQVNTYNTTDVIMAPERRISFSTDMFSMAATMIHLVTRLYLTIKCNYETKNIYNTKNYTSYKVYLSDQSKFGQDGYDLLCNLLNSDPNNRYCSNKALLHPYFDEIREIEKGQNIEIDRTIVGLLGGKRIWGLEQIVRYTPDNFAQKNLELCYYEELHLNYKDDIFPIQSIENTIDYHHLMNWLLQHFNTRGSNEIFYGLDTLLNAIIHTNNNFIKYKSDEYTNTFLNVSMFHDIFTDAANNTIDILAPNHSREKIIETFYANLDININLYPVSNHISYIYLQLLYNIQKLENSYEFSIEFYYDVSVMVIFWFIQPIPFDEPITNWEIVVFSTIQILSNILKISGVQFIRNPILPILVIDENRYTKMYAYCTQQYSTMNFDKFKNYDIYFNNDDNADDADNDDDDDDDDE